MDLQPRPRAAPPSALPERSAARAQLDVTQPRQPAAATDTRHNLDLAPGQLQHIAQTGPATWQELRLRVRPSELAKLRTVRLRVHWEGALQPAIELPLLDLFSSSWTPPERDSRALASRVDEAGARVYALRLPMPFRQRAELFVSNVGPSAVSFELELSTSAGVPSAAFGHLHVTSAESVRPTLASYTLASARGHGRIVGICVHAEGYADASWELYQDPFNFLEGDVRATLDGQLALDGTGTEDYADDVFYFIDAPQASAFAQAWGKRSDIFASPQGQIDFCHWHVLGTELDFQTDADVSLELGAHKPALFERVHSVAYLYLEE